MEKKKAEKTKAKPVKKAEAKAAKKPAKAKAAEKEGVKRVAAAKESIREKGSITPPTEHLVDAFSLFKRGSSSQRQAPAVTRLPAGGMKTLPAAPPPKAAPPPALASVAAAPAAPPPKAPPPATPVPGAPVQFPKPVMAPPLKPPTRAAPPPKAAPAAPARQAPRPPGPYHKPAHRPHHEAKPAAPAPAAHPAETAPARTLKPLKVTTQVTVRELAEKMGVRVNDLIKRLMSMGVFATINQRLDSEAAILTAHDFGYDLEVSPIHMEEELGLKPETTDKPESLKPRSPVVTIMGHVDHGKTSLLDSIRSASVAEGEAGGITQHIGAYKVKVPKGEITFLDTPGHEAFTAMRARGAKVTDIVILVVSAADGVMPQTVEAIDHAKAAGVPIIVAVNKVDLPTAQPQRIRQELSQHGLNPEDWGGKHIFVDVSAKKKLNLDKLLEMILLQAEVMELKANPDRPGLGVILEARMDSKRGPLVTLLVQKGTVKVGDAFVVGVASGKVKALTTDQGDRISAAGPSLPVEVLGVSGELPQAGDIFSIVAGERQAKEISEKRRVIHREETLAHKKHVSLVGLKSDVERGAKELRVILKADVQGSIQAIKDSLEKLSTPEIGVNVIHAGTGNVNDSDVLLAEASDAVILLFHVGVDSRAEPTVTRTGVEVRKYEIIYDLLADVKAAMEGLLEPEVVDVVTGKAEVKQIFTVKGAKVAGCIVREGKVVRGGQVRILRGGQASAETKIEGLKRFKDDASEVEKGVECGIALATKDIQVGDILEAYIKEKRTRRLESTKAQ